MEGISRSNSYSSLLGVAGVDITYARICHGGLSVMRPSAAATWLHLYQFSPFEPALLVPGKTAVDDL
ncbi:unnamed protein product [Victoria cruziana]